MDISEFVKISVAGFPLLFIVMGLVTWLGNLGIAGKKQFIASMLVGLLIGIPYQVAQGTTVDFAGWFAAVIFGIGLGLIASGIYDTAKKTSKTEVTLKIEGLSREDDEEQPPVQ